MWLVIVDQSEPVSEPYKLVYTDLFSKYTAMLEKIMVGGAVQARPRGLKAAQFQTLIVKKDDFAFNLNHLVFV